MTQNSFPLESMINLKLKIIKKGLRELDGDEEEEIN